MSNTFTPPIPQGSNKKPRIHWLDVSRGIAFLMVIYSHLEFCNDSVMKYFTPVFLTTFFFVSGYLFKEHCSFSKVFEQRTRTLFLPFLCMGMIMILLSQVLTFNEKVSLADEVKGLLLQNGENQILWFIAALYVYSVGFYWVERWSGNTTRMLIVCTVLFILNGIYLKMGLPKIPWHIEAFGNACFYMGLGKWYKENEQRICHIIDNKRVVAATFAFYASIITVFDLHVSFGNGNWIVDAWSVTIPGLIVMLYVSKHWFQNSRFLLFVGANTLFYFAFHGKVYSLLQTICHKAIASDLLASDGAQFAIAVCIVALDALILILPAMFVNKYCPFLLGKGFKLWKA